jgi:hypothetical protein
MSFASNWANIFGLNKNPPAPPAAAAPVTNNPNNNPPPQGTQQSAQTAPNGVVPTDGDKGPLGKYENLWQPPTKEEQEATSQQTPANIGVDPAKLLEAAGKVDFTKVLNQEALAKVAAGGEGAVAALVEIMQKSNQTVYGQSMVAANRMVEEAVKVAEQRFAAQVPQLVKKQAASETLFSENPAFQNPAIQPIVAALQSQLQEKYPKATTKELNNMAKEMLEGSAKLFMGNQSQSSTQETKGAPKEEDWSMYLESPQQR